MATGTILPIGGYSPTMMLVEDRGVDDKETA
jgi:hypothetical protein